MVALALGALALTGCTVAVPEAPLDPAQTAVCRALVDALPKQVLDQGRRRVEPGTVSAAWGRPAIVLRCGVPQPATLTAASECLEVNGVGWYAEEAQGGYLFTTIGRPVFVELAVPTAYAPEAAALTDVAAAVTAHVRLDRPCV